MSEELHATYSELSVIAFIRDNIARSIQKADPDYSRNIEGEVLRLHWDQYELLTLLCNRLRIVFGLTMEKSVVVWNRCVAAELQGKNGFEKVLRMTLYRPRDLLALLNKAFYTASRNGRERVVTADLEAGATEISKLRLDDLIKEYREVIPGLDGLTRAFRSAPRTMKLDEAENLLETELARRPDDQSLTRDYEILGGARGALRVLYGVGFLGVQKDRTSVFSFCHDGSSDGEDLIEPAEVMVHPCYWSELQVDAEPLPKEAAELIHDDYAIEVESETPDLRKKSLGRLMNHADGIALGQKGWRDWENWCLKAVKVIFAGKLQDIQHQANGAATQRRDVVGTITTDEGVWRRIRDDYDVRHAIFECKNKEKLDIDDFRQMNAYLCDNYGRLGCFLTRGAGWELEKGGELDWVREMWAKHRHLMVKMPHKVLKDLLGKLRSPQKHDAAEKRLHKILTQYERLYIEGQSGKKG